MGLKMKYQASNCSIGPTSIGAWIKSYEDCKLKIYVNKTTNLSPLLIQSNNRSCCWFLSCIMEGLHDSTYDVVQNMYRMYLHRNYRSMAIVKQSWYILTVSGINFGQHFSRTVLINRIKSNKDAMCIRLQITEC